MEFLFSTPPQGPTALEVAPGLFWLRLPMPLKLDHVNVWLADDGDGWTAIDSGLNTADTRDIWDAVRATLLAGRPVTRLIATHGHSDHIGFAGLLCRQTGAVLHAPIVEWTAARLRLAVNPAHSKAAGAHYRRHGCTDHEIAAIQAGQEMIQNFFAELPDHFVRLRHGQQVTFGGRTWQAVAFGGHANEHLSFYSPADRVLIAGDQVLSHITPLIGVGADEPWGDPLKDYLDSLDWFEALPEDTLVLPSHGLPFHGVRARVGAIRNHHRMRLEVIRSAAGASSTAMSIARTVFPRAAASGHTGLALAETLAHLNRLTAEALMKAMVDEEGRLAFRSA